ncbi:hypothetical protein A9Q83_13050 [Alphaproteobacteria bacterium 46_93_T64]|nr:hypothetical protein A9Q83_13050 [Alphaproteobacteria bacterium 46_93_T64]
MLDYALEQLVDGISLPGVLLITLPIFLIFAWISSRRGLFYANTVCLIAMSLPITGKALLIPIDVGTPFEDVKLDEIGDQVDAIALIASGAVKDKHSNIVVISTGALFRLKRAEALVQKVPLPLIVSGVEGMFGQNLKPQGLTDILDVPDKLIEISGAKGTAEHAVKIASVMEKLKIKRLAVFVTGIHAYRTKRVLEAHNLQVPLVIVGLNDAVFGWRDLVPSFNGFFYWKHALKEYAGLIVYKWHDII